MAHSFLGKWITTAELAAIPPRNVFHRQLEKVMLPDDGIRNRHVLFRRRFTLDGFARAILYISADDYYKLYINGVFVGQGPAPAYHFRYGYNVIDVTPYLLEGENVIAVHTLYQGLINRVWQSGDGRHGLILDLVADGETVLFSGTPCQVASLRSFLGKEYASLYCIDLICHGVGAPALFAEDIKRCAKGKKITKLSFRDKSNGWGTSGRLITEKRNIK